MLEKNTPLFKSAIINKLHISNRFAVAPMTRVSAEENGCVGPLMKEYYQNFAAGGFGLIFTEGLYTDELYSQGYFEQPGIANEIQAKSWEPIVEAVHHEGSVIIAQLMHAGALSQYNHNNYKTIAPSSIIPKGEQMAFYHGEGKYPEPREMTQEDINHVIQGFVTSAAYAKSSGFDGIEIHGANGYLLDQFFTDYTNQRNDEYSGSVSNRLKIYKDIITKVRKVVGSEFIIGVRFSQKKVNDNEHIWSEGELTAQLTFSMMKECGVDYIHTTEPELNMSAFKEGDSLAKLAKKYSGLPIVANGGVNGPELALLGLNEENADIISIGKSAIVNPNWPQLVNQNSPLKPFDFGMLSPIANLKSAMLYKNNCKK